MREHKEHRRKRRWNQRYFLQVVCLLVAAVVFGGRQQTMNEQLYQKQSIQMEEESFQGNLPVSQEAERLQQTDTINTYSNGFNQKQELIDSNIRGAYFTANSVSNRTKVEKIIQSLEGTEINAVVIDVKDDCGKITFDSKHMLATEIDAVSPIIWNLREMVDQFHAAGIYVIGRVVAFRDPILAILRPSYAILDLAGNVFYDRAKDAWLNPYHRACWDYLVEIAMEAADSGVDEIQFDYVRFSTEAKEGKVSFGVNVEKYTKTQVITEFIQYVVKQLHQKDVKVSADVFGAIINSEIDAKTVGQDYVELSRYLDYICPMVYPSHYADGCYGIEVPDLQPYDLIVAALNDSNHNLKFIDEEYHCAIVRPWLQDFTASWKAEYQRYGVQEVTEQIQGVYDSGYQEWLLWNSSGRYSLTVKE